MHFLRVDECHGFSRFEEPRAAVMVKLVKKDVLQISVPSEGQQSIFIAATDTEWAVLPERVKVVDANNKVVRPSKGRRFYVTTSTFNPFHGVTEAE